MPGPHPAFRPAFPDDFLEQARCQARRRTIAYHAVQRFRLALLLHQEPDLDNEEAGRRVGLSGRQVRRWRQRWAQGDFGVADFPGRGRKALFSPPG
jgi:hypothetical protein